MTDVVIECPSETATNISCRDMPHITLPCRCSWTSIVGYLPPRLTVCVDGEITLLHGVNLA